MNIEIRQATVTDAEAIAPLIYNAIGEIANRLTGESSLEKTLELLRVFVRGSNNRHSHLYTHVATLNDEVVGIVVLYDGKQGKALDAYLQNWLLERNGTAPEIDVEAHDDEYYIDTISVGENVRGLGIGTQLLQFAEKNARELGYSKLSLNVEEQKVNARRLYERIGFVVTKPWTIIDEPFHHMVKQLN